MRKKTIVLLLIVFAIPQSVIANEAIKCYQIAWEHPLNGGLGLNRGQAVRLCSGTDAASETLECYSKAWEQEENGGLGLNKGQAIRLCKNNSLPED